MERRCVIPASGFYEWDENGAKKYFTGDGKILYLCGFTKPSDGENRFIIITKEATPPVKKFHDRIPVIAGENIIERYLCDMSFASGFILKDNKVKLKTVY